MKLRTVSLLGLALSASTLASSAAEALVPVAPPTEFRTVLTKTLVPVVFSQSSGEAFNPINKSAIEAQCEAARQTGLTDKHPVFEAGHGKPVKTESMRFGNATQRAHFSILHAYECVRPEGRPAGADGVCGCTYRVRLQHRLEIRNTRPSGVETLKIDLEKGSAQRSVTAVPSALDSQRDAARVIALAPEVVGRDTVAGIACVVRRQRLGAEGHIDRCIAEDPEHRLPPEVRFQALSETVPSQDGKSTYRWSRTDKVVLNATVDAGVFMLPSGIVIKEIP